MKRHFLLFAFIGITASMALSGCTKEQLTINMLYGTWKLDSQLDDNGDPVSLPAGTTVEFLRTFYRCTNKENTSCPGSIKTTTTSTVGGSTITTIDGGSFNYSIFGKSQLLMGGTYYEIETVKKGELVVHPVEHPLATSTYSK